MLTNQNHTRAKTPRRKEKKQKKTPRAVLKAQPQSTKAKTVDVMRGRVRGA